MVTERLSDGRAPAARQSPPRRDSRANTLTTMVTMTTMASSTTLGRAASLRRGHRKGGRAHRATSTRTMATSAAATSLASVGAASVKGTVRKANEDRYSAYRAPSAPSDGSPSAIVSVFDGHGGSAVSEWLSEKLNGIILEEWKEADFPLEALRVACLKADNVLVQPPEGFFAAFGERGVGGAKCGSTAAVCALYEEGGVTRLCTANVGDARIVLVRGGKPVQLSVDHVPDDEAERKRIDRGNPNLRKSLVSFTEGSWRVGGVLALSRAFGDSFLKESGRFEGFGEKNADYGSGFGLNAEPDCYIETVGPEDTWVCISSDGLIDNPERGGGGGFTNEDIADFLNKAPADASPESLAKELVEAAVKRGSTDDITVQLIRL